MYRACRIIFPQDLLNFSFFQFSSSLFRTEPNRPTGYGYPSFHVCACHYMGKVFRQAYAKEQKRTESDKEILCFYVHPPPLSCAYGQHRARIPQRRNGHVFPFLRAPCAIRARSFSGILWSGHRPAPQFRQKRE